MEISDTSFVSRELETLKSNRPQTYRKILNASRTYGAAVHLNHLSVRNLEFLVERNARRGYKLSVDICHYIRDSLGESQKDIARHINEIKTNNAKLYEAVISRVSKKMKNPDDAVPEEIGEALLSYRLAYIDMKGKYKLHILTYLTVCKGL